MTATQDIRWQQRFANLQLAYARLQQAITAQQQTPDNALIQMALIKAFEMTFELSWKTLKDYLNYNGVDVKLPRDVIKQSFAHNMIEDGQGWINMLDARNLMAHTYDEDQAQLAVKSICKDYWKNIMQVHDYLLARLP